MRRLSDSIYGAQANSSIKMMKRAMNDGDDEDDVMEINKQRT